MNRLKAFFVLSLLCLVFSGTGIVRAEDTLFLGSKTPYPVTGTAYTSAPAGYEPAFIYFAGRHGSRNLSGFKYDKTWLDLLGEAEKAGQITNMGKFLKTEIQKIADFEKDRYGLLTTLGKKELYNIGKRTGENFKTLFQSGKPLLADATYVDRSQESRDGFLDGLKSTGYAGEITSTFYKLERDPYLRPYDIAQKYLTYNSKGKWIAEVEAFSQNDAAKAMAKRICLQFVYPAFLDKLEAGKFNFVDTKKKTIINNAITAASSLYELYIIGPSLRDEGLADVDMRKYFLDEELQMMERIQVAKEFNSQGPGMPESNGISVNIMAPLVKRMIVEVDSALASGDKVGVFSFAHAETQIPLVAFLEIEGSCTPYASMAEAVKNWNTADFGPMGGNIQWIVYTAPGKEPLVKMTLLEKETAFPKALIPVSGFYYRWADVRSYYAKKVEGLGIKLTSSIYDNIQSMFERF
jgi:multiple inositol-polyphosphate phosphatase / 2,3-bisphosphoglycerate 3-phosphatase